MSGRISLVALMLGLAACQRPSTPPAASADFSKLTSDFVYSILGVSPVLATGAGYHKHGDVVLDEKLDDMSAAGLAAQRSVLIGLQKRMDAFEPQSLTPEERADLAIMRDQVWLFLLELDTIQNYKHNPTVYVEMIGNGLFTPLVLEYADKPTRIGHIIKRLEQVPAVAAAAKANLMDAPDVWNRVAREENEGNLGLIEKAIPAQAPAEMKAAYEKAAAPAVQALKDLNAWLEKDLARRTSDWRLGKQKYARKLRSALGTDLSPEQLLKEAEADLERIRGEMRTLAGGDVPAALRKIAEKHATVDTYFSDARRDLDEARKFVQDKRLLPLPPRDNLKVIETPEFMRGIYGVGGFNSAPPLQPELGAFYWLTPIPKTWPKERIESKLREYNYYGLKLLTIHEAMPGHYVQLEYANDLTPTPRRVLRGVFGSGPYIEGWAVYATEMMLDEGYLEHSKELRLTFLKQQLRMIANAILDVRMQTMDMKDEEAMSLMLDRTYQEKEEATAKLQRAKLSSTQLPTYYVGYREWKRLRDQSKQMPLAQFHERALKESAVPMRVLSGLLK
jgi:uncharacterized protein (DUF885 family)